MKILLINLILVSCLSLAFSSDSPKDYRYKYEVLNKGFERPMQMKRAPNGDIYINELAGALIKIDSKTYEKTEIGKIEVFNGSENGFLGIALPSDFNQTGNIYLHYSPIDESVNQVSRFTIVNGKLDLSTEKVLLKWPTDRKSSNHNAGGLEFGPNGNLFISTGDNTNPFKSNGSAPIDERTGQTPFDAQRSSANSNDLRGKILRITPTPDGGYTIPEGNLFKPGNPKARAEIYAMGFRNPWRFKVNPKTGTLYVGDVGPDAGKATERGPEGIDTINQIKKPGFYGWPYARGTFAYRDYDFETEKLGELFSKTAPINESKNNTGLKQLPPVTDPIVWYNRQPEYFPLMGAGGRTACGGPVYHFQDKFKKTDGFPAFYNNCVLLYDWARPNVVWGRLDKEEEFQDIEPFTSSLINKLGDLPEEEERFRIKRFIDAFFGPNDGCLYVLDYGETWGVNEDTQLVKISYIRGNLDPKASIAISVDNGDAPLSLELDASQSMDPEKKPLEYTWILSNKNVPFSKNVKTSLTLEQEGNYNIQLEVKDPEGAIARKSVDLVVGNNRPSLSFDYPKHGDFFDLGSDIKFKVNINDKEDGNTKDKNKGTMMSPMTLVTDTWLDANNKKASSAVGLTHMKQSDCFNCHAIDKKMVGPGLIDIAERYRGQPMMADVLSDRVIKGTAGQWGVVPMLPHPKLIKDQVHLMVEWILSLKKGDTLGVVRGIEGEVKSPKSRNTRRGLLQATYTDMGKDTLKKLSASTTVQLRSRTIEAEDADEILGAKRAHSGKASGKKILGSMSGQSVVKFSNINLAQFSSMTIRYALPGKQVRQPTFSVAGANDPFATGSASPSGGWHDFITTDIPLTNKKGSGKATVIFKPNGSMNLDWVRFNK